MKRKYILIGTVILICGLIAYKLTMNKKELDSKKNKPVTTEISIPVKVVKVKDSILALNLSKTGSIIPFREAKVLATVSGTLKNLQFSLGDQVNKGQVLAVVDDRTQQLDLQKAERNAKFFPVPTGASNGKTGCRFPDTGSVKGTYNTIFFLKRQVIYTPVMGKINLFPSMRFQFRPFTFGQVFPDKQPIAVKLLNSLSAGRKTAPVLSHHVDGNRKQKNKYIFFYFHNYLGLIFTCSKQIQPLLHPGSLDLHTLQIYQAPNPILIHC
ncbi:efflux RND transporter periplasmic adaptor subunit [Sphingobacterium sp. DR205]|nr:efflux RND transporter periplasmic adaptor subunit [Sphingobacterium sp. DR205]